MSSVTDPNETRWKCPRCRYVANFRITSYMAQAPACPNLDCRGTAMVPAPEWKEKQVDDTPGA